MRRFDEADLPPPLQWNEQGVRQHLREVIEVRLNELTLQQTRAANSDRIRLQIRETDAEIEEAGKGTGCARQRRSVSIPSCRWSSSSASSICARSGTRLAPGMSSSAAAWTFSNGDIAETAHLVRKFVDPWRTPDAPALEDIAGQPDMVLLRGAFDDLRERIDAARNARTTGFWPSRPRSSHWSSGSRRSTAPCRACSPRPKSNRAIGPRSPPGSINFRSGRKRIPRCTRRLRKKHSSAARLVDQPDLVALADEGDRVRLQADRETSTVEAAEHTRLIQEHTDDQDPTERRGKGWTSWSRPPPRRAGRDPGCSKTSATKRCSPWRRGRCSMTWNGRSRRSTSRPCCAGLGTHSRK